MHFIDVNNETSVEKYNNLLPGRHVMVMYYMDGCFFCEQLKPQWDKFETHMKNHKKYRDHDKYVIARVNSNHINSVNGDRNVLGYPTIMHLLDGKKQSEFTDEREKEALVKYFEHMEPHQKGGSKKSKKRSFRKNKNSIKSRRVKNSKKHITKRRSVKKSRKKRN
jgi:thioredoxin-like negative regulator of GroEL